MPFKIDENEILNQDEKLKEFLDKFSGLAANPKHYNLSYCCYVKTRSPAAPKRHRKVYGNPIAPSLYSILLVLTIKSLMKHFPFSHTPQILSLSFIPLFSLSPFFSIFIFSLFHILSFSFFYLFYFFFLFYFFSLLTLFFFLSFFSPSLSFSLFPPSPKKYIDQEPPYLMHQICVLIKKKNSGATHNFWGKMAQE